MIPIPQKPCTKCAGTSTVPVSLCAQAIFAAALRLSSMAPAPLLTFDSLYREVAETGRDYPLSTFRAKLGELVAAGHMHRDRRANSVTGAHRWLVTEVA